jgi:hypothetical protein
MLKLLKLLKQLDVRGPEDTPLKRGVNERKRIKSTSTRLFRILNTADFNVAKFPKNKKPRTRNQKPETRNQN